MPEYKEPSPSSLESTTPETPEMPELPLYNCHKQVRAGKILHIINKGEGRGVTLNLINEKVGIDSVIVIDVSDDYIKKHEPQIGGYYVLYDNDYESFSPAPQFEAGYTLAGANTMSLADLDQRDKLGTKAIPDDRSRTPPAHI